MADIPLVLLHGWGMTPRIWNGLRICLSPRIAATPALPGHGGVPSPGPDLAAWSDALLAELPAHCVLGGWSLGGMLALDIARRHPQRVRHLVLFGATPCFVSRAETLTQPAWAHGLAPDVVRGFRDGFGADPDATLRRFLALQATGESRRRGVVHSLGRAVVAPDEYARQGLADGLGILVNSDLRGAVADVRTPVTLIHGRDDALMPLAAAEWLAAHLPQARLTVLDDCGHAPFVSRSEDCARAMAGAFDGA
jgi:pimeloyl-[acyl-carrier protein] methyl ester esterase